MFFKKVFAQHVSLKMIFETSIKTFSVNEFFFYFLFFVLIVHLDP